MQKRDYILQNPVRAELAATPDDGPYQASWQGGLTSIRRVSCCHLGKNR
jgi:hypothetical protein